MNEIPMNEMFLDEISIPFKICVNKKKTQGFYALSLLLLDNEVKDKKKKYFLHFSVFFYQIIKEICNKKS